MLILLKNTELYLLASQSLTYWATTLLLLPLIQVPLIQIQVQVPLIPLTQVPSDSFDSRLIQDNSGLFDLVLLVRPCLHHMLPEFITATGISACPLFAIKPSLRPSFQNLPQMRLPVVVWYLKLQCVSVCTCIVPLRVCYHA